MPCTLGPVFGELLPRIHCLQRSATPGPIVPFLLPNMAPSRDAFWLSASQVGQKGHQDKLAQVVT